VKVGEHELLLFPNCVKSIVESVDRNIPCELLVADFESDDWPLREWLEQTADPIPIQIITTSGLFSRGKGLNLAARAAQGDILFFIDADSLLCPSIVYRGLSFVQEGKAYFPVIFKFDGPEHKSGKWRHDGYGHCMINKAVYDLSKGWPEYDRWGTEDNDFFSRISTIQEIVREKVPGFYHQWHPDDLVWKNRYSHPSALREFEQQKVALRELSEVIPPGETFIFVDEDRFMIYETFISVDRHALPFLERNGKYFGPPPDDATAISEFERLISKGASFIAFAWMAFWWLDYYSELNKYIRSISRITLENERLIVFDLRPSRSQNNNSKTLDFTQEKDSYR